MDIADKRSTSYIVSLNTKINIYFEKSYHKAKVLK